MAGPFYLPADIAEGDYVEISNLGAYGVSMRTGFNGFSAYDEVVVEDGPMMSVFNAEAPSPAIKKEQTHG
jgi:ornithine decarboxylase